MKKGNMPDNTGEVKVKRTDKRTAGEGKRKRLIRLSPAKARRWRWFFSIASVLLLAVLVLTVVMAINHYRLYPGRVERDSISSPGRGADYIILGWDEPHNANVYKVWYRENETPEKKKEPAAEDAKDEEVVIDDSWTALETDVPEITVSDLKKDTTYSFIIRADSKDKEGVATEPRSFSTKKSQRIKGRKKITKFTFSKPFKLKLAAETDLMYESGDEKVAVVDPETNEIKITGAGDTEITVTARSSSEYESASKTVELKVIDSKPVSAGGASPQIIYHLDADNCEVVKTVTGADGASVPQGLAYTGDKYIISYGMGSPNRVISFDVEGEGKDVSVPTISMGHPNGFTYANENGRCYCAKGWTSKVYTYEPTSGSYGSVDLSYGCSGIGYDRKAKLLYTCSRTAMVAYDISDGYSVKYRCGVVKHSGSVYTQDCGGHAGIMLRCLSGSSKHGTNYIDLYDMKNGRYLGTFTCDLSEVESCIVDKDGFLEILANNTSSTDYIWKTDLNIETLGEGLK
ncbi:MAG: fibronectin type III domain-containing protein [Mogibacterium sp.]|nr:fibronectin type III domain-containing protein [Mogibacterium sp.]